MNRSNLRSFSAKAQSIIEKYYSDSYVIKYTYKDPMSRTHTYNKTYKAESKQEAENKFNDWWNKNHTSNARDMWIESIEKKMSKSYSDEESVKAGLFNDDNWDTGDPSHTKTFKKGTHTKKDLVEWINEMSEKDGEEYEVMFWSDEDNDYNPYVKCSWL